MALIRSICVYCGSSPGRGDTYMRAGTQLGRAIAEAGLRLVYGGGTKGIMGAVAAAAADHGGHITGIIPRFLVNREATESKMGIVDELIITDDMHQRKHAMFQKSDAFVALPGGIGTLEEIVEIMTWAQLGHHAKPIAFVNVQRFWDPMLALVDHMRAEGFVHTAHLVKPLVIDKPEAVVPAILTEAANVESPQGVTSLIDRM